MVKKASQERLASRISALSDITLNDDDGLPNLICAKWKRRVESLENHTEVAEGHEKSLAESPNFHYTPQGRIEPPKAAKGHATYIDSKMLSVTK